MRKISRRTDTGTLVLSKMPEILLYTRQSRVVNRYILTTLFESDTPFHRDYIFLNFSFAFSYKFLMSLLYFSTISLSPGLPVTDSSLSFM